MSADDREKSAPDGSAHQRPSLLSRLNLVPWPEEKTDKPHSRALLKPDVESHPGRHAEKSSGASEPKATQNGPKTEALSKEARWDDVRRVYVETNESIRALADAFSISYPAAKRRAKKEGWQARRASFQQELEKKLEETALVSRAEAHEIQTQAARETIGIFRRVFTEKARALRADPGAKSAADDLARLIALQLDVYELSLSILGDVEIDWRAERLSAPQAG